jgi:hypothetical protein
MENLSNFLYDQIKTHQQGGLKEKIKTKYQNQLQNKPTQKDQIKKKEVK